MPPESRTFIEEARRAQIIQCAIDVLATEGYARASMARIAKQAKISTGVISYHFGGKRQLLEAVIGEVARMATEMMLPRILAQPTATEGLRAYFESNLEFMRVHRGPLLAMVEIITYTRDSGGPGPYALQHDTAINDVMRLLDWGHRTGEFRDFDPRSMAIAIRGVVDAVPARLVQDPELDLDLLAQEFVALFTLATRRQP
ncbi:TetR/AcrR family transcriptional regulator [Nonomuraea glycinis]|uniref:TetR/AcrR family transcriptional regulator n=1 Tax=Nonomuraea glycinis TaxID=2047744 RepID=UPI002E0E440C|nr:TetR family transcriptional regulator [Nonomuraea glycinis]